MMGPQLANDMYEQALNFGAQLKMTEVKSIVDEGDYKKVITSKEELEDSLEKFLDKVKRYNRIANQYMFLEDRIEMSFLKKDLVKLLKDYNF